jgi:hypothetical protein
MILLIQLLIQVLPLWLWLSRSFTKQVNHSYFVHLMRQDHTIFRSGAESALGKLETSTGTSTVALYKHYKLYKPNKPNKTRVKEHARCSRNDLVKKWTGEKKKGSCDSAVILSRPFDFSLNSLLEFITLRQKLW